MEGGNERLLPKDTLVPSQSCQEMDVDEVFEKTVPFGKFQLCLQIAVFCYVATVAYQQTSLYFIGYNPPWTCTSKNSSHFCQSNFGKEMKSGDINYTARCGLGRDEWKYTQNKEYSYVSEFDLICDGSLVASIVGGIFCVGAAFGSFISGLLADIYGRKPIILVTLILNGCVSLGSSYVSKVWQLIVLRCLNGALEGTCLDTSIVMMSEFVTTRHRPISFNICLLAVNISNLLLDAVAYFEKEWRLLQLYCSLPSLLLFFVFIFSPESPRWLLSVGKTVKAKKVLQFVSQTNGKPLLMFNLKSAVDKKSFKKYTYFDLLKNGKIVMMILIIGWTWLTLGLSMFTSTLLMSDVGGNMYTNFAIAICITLPTYCISMYVSHQFGRKRTTLIPMLLSGIISGIISLLLKVNKGNPSLMVTLTALVKCFACIAFSSSYIWTFELYPTVVRLQGMAFAAFMLQIGNAGAPFLTNVLQTSAIELPYFIMFILTIISTLLGTGLVETKNLRTREHFADLNEAHTSVDSHHVETHGEYEEC